MRCQRYCLDSLRCIRHRVGRDVAAHRPDQELCSECRLEQTGQHERSQGAKGTNDDQHLQQRVEYVFVYKGRIRRQSEQVPRQDPRDQAEQNNVAKARADRAGREEQRGFVIHAAYDEHARREVAASVIGRRLLDFARTTGPTVDEERANRGVTIRPATKPAAIAANSHDSGGLWLELPPVNSFVADQIKALNTMKTAIRMLAIAPNRGRKTRTGTLKGFRNKDPEERRCQGDDPDPARVGSKVSHGAQRDVSSMAVGDDDGRSIARFRDRLSTWALISARLRTCKNRVGPAPTKRANFVVK